MRGVERGDIMGQAALIAGLLEWRTQLNKQREPVSLASLQGFLQHNPPIDRFVMSRSSRCIVKG
jgi:hypothetical protein